MHVVTGKVTTHDPPKTLEHTLFPPNAEYPDIPENHLNVRYQIEKERHGSRLQIRQWDYEKGSRRRKALRRFRARLGYDFAENQGGSGGLSS